MHHTRKCVIKRIEELNRHDTTTCRRLALASYARLNESGREEKTKSFERILTSCSSSSSAYSTLQMAKRQLEEEEADDDLVCFEPGALPRRGWPKSRRKYKNAVSKCSGKLDTDMFERHLENLWRSISADKKNLFAYFDCLWYSLYTKEKEPSTGRVLNWIKRKRIFSKKYVFVPIVQWRHWSLLILCNFGDCSQSHGRTPCMLLLDSLRMANPKRLEPGIRKFVLDIYRTEDRAETKKLISQIPLLVPKVPQQRNQDECGNYVLYFINLFVESAPENFSISEGYPYFMKEDWFSPDSLDSFCKKLDSITPNNVQKFESEPLQHCEKLDSEPLLPCKKLDSELLQPCGKLDSEPLQPCGKLDSEPLQPCGKLDSEPLQPCKKLNYELLQTCRKLDYEPLPHCEKLDSDRPECASTNPSANSRRRSNRRKTMPRWLEETVNLEEFDN